MASVAKANARSASSAANAANSGLHGGLHRLRTLGTDLGPSRCRNKLAASTQTSAVVRKTLNRNRMANLVWK